MPMCEQVSWPISGPSEVFNDEWCDIVIWVAFLFAPSCLRGCLPIPLGACEEGCRVGREGTDNCNVNHDPLSVNIDDGVDVIIFMILRRSNVLLERC